MTIGAAAALPPLPGPILVVGAYGYRNAGDEAILAGILRLLDGTQVTVVSRRPAETTALHGVPAVGIAGAVAALARHRSVLIGGGGLFGSDLGRLGRLVAPFGLAAAAAHRTVAIAGVGVDAELPGLTAVALQHLAPRLAACTVRDASSAAVLKTIGVDASIGDDLSTALVPAPESVGPALLADAGLDPVRPTVGLCLTALGPGDPAQRLATAVTAVRQLIEDFPQLQFCFVPMSQHPYVAAHDDLRFGRQLRTAAPRLAILGGVHHPARLLALFGRFAAVVGMRYHSLLFAERVGVPLVAVPYAEKCRSWLAERRLEPTPLTGPDLSRSLAGCLQTRLAWTA
jgi:polysaccharide pyruvyl transferase WcaK-like protein